MVISSAALRLPICVPRSGGKLMPKPQNHDFLIQGSERGGKLFGWHLA
jgi:hypothetical protein